MRIERHDGGQERQLLIGMIASRPVLAAVSASWNKDGLFESRWTNLIAGWCVSYYGKYRKPPGRNVETMYDQWITSENPDRDTAKIVERFLSAISDEYGRLAKTVNPDYLIDLAGDYFERVRLNQLSQQVTAELEDGDVKKARTLVDKFRHVELGRGEGIDVMSSEESVTKALEVKSEPSLIEYPGDVGKFVNPYLERDSLIAFMGPEKRGKTFNLLDAAHRAHIQKRRTAFFSVGDMSRDQIMRRYITRIARHTLQPQTVKIPTSIMLDGVGAMVTHEEVKFERPLSKEMVMESMREFRKLYFPNDETSYFKLFCYPNSTISATGIATVLHDLQRDGWPVDVIALDYADILAPINGKAETREQINMTWKTLRAVSQEYHACLVTATQSDTDSYTAEIMNMGNFSEDKRKNAHVTAMIGLNQTSEEKLLGLMRWNFVALREGEFSDKQCVYVAGCLALANPVMKSVAGFMPD